MLSQLPERTFAIPVDIICTFGKCRPKAHKGKALLDQEDGQWAVRVELTADPLCFDEIGTAFDEGINAVGI